MMYTSRCCKIVCIGAIIVTALFESVSESYAQSTTKGLMPSAEQLAKANLTYKVIAAEGSGYGYDVFADEKMLIHQPTIPGQPGISGFRKRSDAEKVAKLVIRKLRTGEIPPAITEEELKKLKVIE
jgi:hypothetical protein